MHSSHQLVALGLAIAAAFISWDRAAAEEFRSEAGRFRFQAPPNWVRFNAFKLAQIRGAGATDPTTSILEGFQPAGLRPGFDGVELPFLFVVEERNSVSPLLTHDMIERFLNNEFRREFERGGGNRGKVGVIKFDRARNRFAAPLDMKADNGVPMRGKIYGFLGKNSVVLIACFAREQEFAAHENAFDASAESFQYDPGFQYAQVDFTKLGLAIVGIGGCTCTLIFFVIAAIVGLLIWMNK